MAEETATTTETVTTETTVDNPATETDEDYKWLTERLDAHTTELNRVCNLVQSQMEALRELTTNQNSESRTLIQALTEMVQSQSQSLSAIAAASALSRSTQTTLTNTSPVEEPIIVTETVNPESAESIPVEMPPVERKRKRL